MRYDVIYFAIVYDVVIHIAKGGLSITNCPNPVIFSFKGMTLGLVWKVL